MTRDWGVGTGSRRSVSWFSGFDGHRLFCLLRFVSFEVCLCELVQLRERGLLVEAREDGLRFADLRAGLEILESYARKVLVFNRTLLT